MILRAVFLTCAFNELPTGKDSEGSWFDYRGRNLGYYLTLRLKKLRFKQDSYNRIVISASSKKQAEMAEINPVNNLIIDSSFDVNRYRSLKTDEEFNEYFIELYTEGFNNIEKKMDVPLPKKELFQWMKEYRNGDYKNVWEFKKRLFREVGIRAVLDCEMTLEEFNLTLRLYSSTNNKELLFEKVILTTPPDEIMFHHQFKDVILDGTTLKVISRSYDALEHPLYEMEIKQIVRKL